MAMPALSRAYLGSGLRARPATLSDQALLQTIYASTRKDELAALAGSPAMRDSFIAMQFEAQQRHMSTHYPAAAQWLIERNGVAVGRLWLSQNEQSLQVLDITVLPASRGQGIGRACLRHLIHHADAQEWTVELHVRADNPVRNWYARLGFATTETRELYLAMSRPPLDFLESRYEQA